MVAKTTLDVIEASADVLEERLEPLLEVGIEAARWTRRHYITLGVATQIAFVGGGALAYYFTKRNLQTKYDIILEEQIAKTKDYYSKLNKREAYSSPASTLETLTGDEDAVKTLREYQGDVEQSLIPPVEAETKNIFEEASADDIFDYEEELKKRTTDFPYIITHVEYMQNEHDYEQSSFTYYLGDKVLADERDQPIELVDKVVGEDNLKFGHGSGDDSIVFIQNDELSMQFEVMRNTGKFAHEVLGFEHSDRRPRIRKFRGDDE